MKKSLTVALSIIGVAALALGTGVRTAEHSFNTEYRLAARVPSEPGGDPASGSSCRLAFFIGESDRSLYNPELLMPHSRVIDCRHQD